MQAPEPILRIWRSLDGVPAEGFTHRWWLHAEAGDLKQRTIPQMEQHRARLGSGGDKYDLAIWLMAKYQAAGYLADAVGPPPDQSDSDRIAVMVKDPFGRRYLCDLSEPWTQPILVSPRAIDFVEGFHAGFHPEGEVSIEVVEKRCRITLRRPQSHGEVAEWFFELRAIPPELLVERAETDPTRVSPETIAVRRRLMHPDSGQEGIWFFEATPRGWQSGWRLPNGVVTEPPCERVEEWVQRIAERSGVSETILFDVLARDEAVR